MNPLTKKEKKIFTDIMKIIEKLNFEKSIFFISEKNIKASYFYQPDDIIKHSISSSINYHLYLRIEQHDVEFFMRKRIKEECFDCSVRNKKPYFKIPEEEASIYNSLFEVNKLNHNIEMQHKFFLNLKYSHQDFIVRFEKHPELLNLINKDNYEPYSYLSNHFSLDQYKKILEYSLNLRKELFDLTIEERDLFNLEHDFGLPEIIFNENKKNNNTKVNV